MKFFRSLLFYIGYFGFLAPHALLCVMVGLFMPLRARYRYFLIWNVFSLWWLRLTCGVKWQINGLENVPPAPFVLMANHQSPWETLFLYWEFLPLCAILKKELLNTPFFGWALRLLKPIAIDRSQRNRALQQMLEQGKASLDNGISVLVFPEGTRVAPGVEKKYSAGGAELAVAAGRPIVPVAHNAGLFWPAHKFIKHAGTIQVEIGKPIDTSGRNAKELTREVETWIRQVL